MTPLRQRYIEDMQLRGLSEGTQQTYITAVPPTARSSPSGLKVTILKRKLPLVLLACFKLKSE